MWMTKRLAPARILLFSLLLWVDSEQSEGVAELSTDFEVSYVIEPFESINNNYSLWFSRAHSDGGYLHLNVTAEDALFGEHSLRVEYSIDALEASGEWGGYVEFGQIEPDRPHICHGATHLSIWYKVVQPHPLGVGRLKLGLVLLDDSHCISSQDECSQVPGKYLENYAFFHYLSDVPESKLNDWQELRIDLLGNSGKSFKKLFSMGSNGNRKLDLAHLRGWRVDLSVEDFYLKGNVSSSSSGVILFDHLACLGGGELFGAGFYTGNNWTDAVVHGGWIEEYYQSEISEERSTVTMEDGVLSINYTIQQVETWGGFNGFSYLAPGNAYYNLSQATHVKLGYHVTEPLSRPGRAHIRLNLADASDCVEDCNGITFWTHERWYSFSYILDGGKGDNVLALKGDTEPTEDFWLTGWSGLLGNQQLNISMLKGYTIEFNIDSQGAHNSTVSGAVVFANLTGAVAIRPPPEEIFYVIEPFESMNNSGWFSRVHDDRSYMELTLTTEDALFGEYALRLEYMINESGNSGGYVDFGVVEPDRPHICEGATHLSVWYKVVQQLHSRGTRNPRLGIVLLDDTYCTNEREDCGQIPGDNLGEYYSFHEMLDADDSGVNGWQEIRIKLSDSTEEPSMNLASSNNQGNKKLDLAHLRGWRMEISVDKDSLASVSSSSSGNILVDQLACVGGGELFGAGFYTGNNWTNAVLHGGWIEEYYQSEISKEHSTVIMEDGVLSFNYTIQQVETWGGFNGFSYLAPGSAYYNLSHATHVKFGYHVDQPQTPSGRAHIRLNLADASDCIEDCHGITFWTHERWYSFSYILDGGQGDNVLALEGSTKPETPFWLTGWSGVLGNQQLDTHMLKGYTIEFNVDSQGDHDSTVSGAVTFKDMAAVFGGYEEESESESKGTGQCVTEPSLFFQVYSPVFTRIEFLGSKCCKTCEEDPTCLYAVSTGRDCFTAPFLDTDAVGLLDTELLQESSFSLWMDNRRGEFCELCHCREEVLTIDCRGKDLLIIPKTFTPMEESTWSPRVLDLRENPKLVLLGSGTLSLFADSLEELWLPFSMNYLGVGSLIDLSVLTAVHFEGEEDGIADIKGGNAIAGPDGIFGDICCGFGYRLDLSSPSWGLGFCDLAFERPGIDSIYLDFIQYQDAKPSKVIAPSSDFMAEASESVEKCAEYCTISEECIFFSYDHRFPNAEHFCYLLLDNGTSAKEICCDEDHYADKERTTPGWISGHPPRTRHEVDGARVIFPSETIVVSPENEYKAHFELSLGSAPLRGAVWIEPTLKTSNRNVEVSVWPDKVALYDANTTVTIYVEVFILSEFKAMTLLVENVISSCDQAFTSLSVASRQSTTVFIEVIPQVRQDSDSNIVVAVAILVVLILIIGSLAFLYYGYAQKRNDMIWKVERTELIFDDPPEIAGRGTFGLVLLAEYRGTRVAVKRVLPPKNEENLVLQKVYGDYGMLSGSLGMMSGSHVGMMSGSHSGMVSGSHGGMVSSSNAGMISGCITLDRITSKGNQSRVQPTKVNSGQICAGSTNIESFYYGNCERKRPSMFDNFGKSNNYRKLKKAFVREMRHLSKLRHPCITTVMGAVICSNEEPMLVMEYMDHGSLYDLLHNETMLLEGDVLLQMLRDITQGARFLHAANPQVIHGDLKAQNILVDSKFRAKVADFGLSQKKQIGATGTPFWMAPELLRGESTNSAASDVYSFGIILYEVYSRKDPYEGEDAQTVLRDVADSQINKRPPIPSNCPSQLASLMSDCIVSDPNERPTFEELDKRLKRIDVDTLDLVGQGSHTERSTISLFDIFPKHIAEALRDGKQVEPEHRDIVTIFFSDIVGFTDISSTLPPRKVAAMLDKLYQKFDDLSDKHDIFKVETIGDAYMAVTNLVKDQPDDHVKRIAGFSVDAIQAANSTLIDPEHPERGCVNIRVGFHSGPVVADVVGSRNPRYCLFGDTVNTASRMESNSMKNRIHCSERSAILLKQQKCKFPILPRGVINVKGKGEMFTYWVNERKIRGSSNSQEDHSSQELNFLPHALDHTNISSAFSVLNRQSSMRSVKWSGEDMKCEKNLRNNEKIPSILSGFNNGHDSIGEIEEDY